MKGKNYEANKKQYEKVKSDPIQWAKYLERKRLERKGKKPPSSTKWKTDDPDRYRSYLQRYREKNKEKLNAQARERYYKNKLK